MNGDGSAGTSASGLPDLLRHAGWLRRLAVQLVRDPDVAEDVVQGTLVSAWSRPPASDRDPRPWLAEVARNQAHDLRRAEQRRRTRQEIAAGDDGPARPAAPATPEQLIGDLEIHRLVATLVTGLDQPYRDTLVLHFYEGLSGADIARRLKLPEGTVRWRLKEGLDRLRVALDRHHQGDRQRWQRALLPLLPAGALPLATGASGAVATAAAAGARTAIVGVLGRLGLSTPATLLLGTAAVAVLASAFVLWASVSPRPPRPDDGGDLGAAALPVTAPLSPARPAATALPRFAVRAPAGDGEIASVRAGSERQLQTLLTAIIDNDYDAFVDGGHDYLKAVFRKDLMQEMSVDIGKHLRGGYQAHPLTLLRRQVRKIDFEEHLWKLEFSDRSADRLIRVLMKDGLVAGFFGD